MMQQTITVYIDVN